MKTILLLAALGYLAWTNIQQNFLAGELEQMAGVLQQLQQQVPSLTEANFSPSAPSPKIGTKQAGCGDVDSSGNIHYCFH